MEELNRGKLRHFIHWLGHPFRSVARGCIFLINLNQTQIRALFSLGMLGGIIALSFQNIGLIMMVSQILGKESSRALFGQMAMDQQWWNNAIMAGFGGILGLVVFGADYFKFKHGDTEGGFGKEDNE
jgi:hypothetical protein